MSGDTGSGDRGSGDSGSQITGLAGGSPSLQASSYTSCMGDALKDKTYLHSARSDNTVYDKTALSNLLSLKDRSVISPVILLGCIKLAEFFIILVSALLIFVFYVGLNSFEQQLNYLAASALGAFVTVILFHALELYSIPVIRKHSQYIARLWLGWSGMFASLAMLAFLVKMGADYSRAWLALWFICGLILLPLCRALLCLALSRLIEQGRLNRRAILIGGGENAQSLIEKLENNEESDIEICGIFDDRDETRTTPIQNYPILGNISEVVELTRSTKIDLLIVTLPLRAENRLFQIMKKLWVLPVDIHLAAHNNKLHFRPRAYTYIGDIPMLEMAQKPLADWDYVLKCLFDKIIGLGLIILALPIMALVALAIKLDSKGPVFFRQKRYGFNNELIEVFKFRSMYLDQSDATASKLVTKNDPRVTRVGRFIRKTSLDELPQLFNVLKGELSIVGPRPHATHAKAADQLYNDVVDGYFARHRVKPGITGWAQINGWRGETDTQEKIQKRVEHDLYYIENWSLLLDLQILIATPLALFKTENAY